MEFGCKVSGVKLMVVMGHESCGTVKSAIDEVKLGNITALLAKIRPAIVMSGDFEGEHISNNHEYVDHVSKYNVLHTIEQIRKESPILKEMGNAGEIKIVGAYYSLHTGVVTFLDGK